jgi:hypothetical protein
MFRDKNKTDVAYLEKLFSYYDVHAINALLLASGTFGIIFQSGG